MNTTRGKEELRDKLSSSELQFVIERAKNTLQKTDEAKKNVRGFEPENGISSSKAYSGYFENLIRLFAAEGQQPLSYWQVVAFATILASTTYNGESAAQSVQNRRRNYVCDIETYGEDVQLLRSRVEEGSVNLGEKNAKRRSFQAEIHVFDGKGADKYQKVRVGFRIPRGVLLDILEQTA